MSKTYCYRCSPEQEKFARRIVQLTLEDRLEWRVFKMEASCRLGETNVYFNVDPREGIERAPYWLHAGKMNIELSIDWGKKLTQKLLPLATAEREDRHAKEAEAKRAATKETMDALLKDLRKTAKPIKKG